jgi:hypothetical protein
LLGLGSSSEGKDNRILAALEDDINYCLDILKINKHDDDEIERRIKELYAQNIAFFGRCHKRLVALKIIADFITLTSNILSQSQLYDFLMLSAAAAAVSAEGMRGHKRLQGTDDIVFKIYRDLMENYQTANDILKVNYPRIIVDVVAILNNGIDMSGKQVSVYRAYDYYLSRKSEPISNNNIARVSISNIISDEDKDTTERDIRSNNDLIQSLVRITGRNSKKIEESLARLSKSNIERIRNLCVNYPKIDKYCRLVASDRKYFIDEIEREQGGGKKLTKYQLQIAVMSITKVREYIENVLDRKFIPHSSHHINHTKHNLEYGYQVMGLIESSKRGGRKEEKSSSKS